MECLCIWITSIKTKIHIETGCKLIMLVCLSMSSSQAHGHLDKLETDTNAVLNCKASSGYSRNLEIPSLNYVTAASVSY